MPKNGENGYIEKAKKELFQIEQGKEKDFEIKKTKTFFEGNVNKKKDSIDNTDFTTVPAEKIKRKSITKENRPDPGEFSLEKKFELLNDDEDEELDFIQSLADDVYENKDVKKTGKEEPNKDKSIEEQEEEHVEELTKLTELNYACDTYLHKRYRRLPDETQNPRKLYGFCRRWRNTIKLRRQVRQSLKEKIAEFKEFASKNNLDNYVEDNEFDERSIKLRNKSSKEIKKEEVKKEEQNELNKDEQIKEEKKESEYKEPVKEEKEENKNKKLEEEKLENEEIEKEIERIKEREKQLKEMRNIQFQYVQDEELKRKEKEKKENELKEKKIKEEEEKKQKELEEKKRLEEEEKKKEQEDKDKKEENKDEKIDDKKEEEKKEEKEVDKKEEEKKEEKEVDKKEEEKKEEKEFSGFEIVNEDEFIKKLSDEEKKSYQNNKEKALQRKRDQELKEKKKDDQKQNKKEDDKKEEKKSVLNKDEYEIIDNKDIEEIQKEKKEDKKEDKKEEKKPVLNKDEYEIIDEKTIAEIQKEKKEDKKEEKKSVLNKDEYEIIDEKTIAEIQKEKDEQKRKRDQELKAKKEEEKKLQQKKKEEEKRKKEEEKKLQQQKKKEEKEKKEKERILQQQKKKKEKEKKEKKKKEEAEKKKELENARKALKEAKKNEKPDPKIKKEVKKNEKKDEKQTEKKDDKNLQQHKEDNKQEKNDEFDGFEILDEDKINKSLTEKELKSVQRDKKRAIERKKREQELAAKREERQKNREKAEEERNKKKEERNKKREEDECLIPGTNTKLNHPFKEYTEKKRKTLEKFLNEKEVPKFNSLEEAIQYRSSNSHITYNENGSEWNTNVDIKIADAVDWVIDFFKIMDTNRKKVVEEVKLKIPKHKYTIPDINDFKTKYESQGYNNCYCCSGTASYNQFLRNEKKNGRQLTNDKETSQKDLRGYTPAFADYKIIKSYICKTQGFKEDDPRAEADAKQRYKQYKDEIMSYAGKDKTNVGSVYELADFFITKQKDIAVHRLLMQVPSATHRRIDGKDIQFSPKDKQTADLRYNNVKACFLNKIHEVLQTGNTLTVVGKLCGSMKHYLTIYGIDGNELLYKDSLSPQEDHRGDVDTLFLKRDGLGQTVELNWFSRVGNVKELTDKYTNLKYDKKNGFSLKQRTVDDVFNVGQTLGVSVSEDVEGVVGVSESIYVPIKYKEPENK